MKLNNSYLLKINSLGNLTVVNRNRQIFELAADTVDHYWVQIQNHSVTEGQFLLTATGETAYTKPTNSIESDKINLLTATPQPESIDVDSFFNSRNIK